jgi:hypothetical protein
MTFAVRKVGALGTFGVCAAAAVVAATACSAFSADDDPAAGDDASTPAAEAGSPDSATPPDAMVDAAAPPQVSCVALQKESNVVFCDDFETETEPASYWGETQISANGGSFSIVPDGKNRVLRVLAAGGGTFASLQRALLIDVKMNVATIDADFRIVSGAYHSATFIDVSAPGMNSNVTIGLAAYGATLVPSRLVPGMAMVTANPGEWHHVRLDLGKTSGATRRKLTVDTTPFVDELADLSEAGALFMRTGIMETSADSNETPSLTVDFDNVVVRRN